ncbi:MAG: AAA family ATPase [Deltaproteobacteria bacterium]|jgi:exonuclease SbcC|nr:AAA family ATPase [Deltaproteobacteria bacterium]
MRLLKLRFKNLNSLSGEWEIDFTNPHFVADRLFIITGPTGSGKSTILDAICLALYGQTPRLGQVSKSANEIMSRQAGECLAEVTFATREGIFRASFSQRRARLKPLEPLQPPHQEIARADNGEILETAISSKITKVAELVGMDFERFTKSILLAQGGFAAFLSAPPRERSPILERVTGTEIYGRLSQLAYRRAETEKNSLGVLVKELESLPLLEAEERAQLTQSLASLTGEEGALLSEQRADQAALGWRQKIGQLREALQTLATEKNQLAQRQADFAPQERRLAQAQVALELENLYGSLLAARDSQARDTASLAQERESLTERQVSLEASQVDLTRAGETLTQKKNQLASAGPRLEQTRDLDRQRAATTENLTAQGAEATTLRQRHEELAGRLTKLQATQAQLTTALATSQRNLAASQADEALTEDLAGLEKEAAFLKEALAQVASGRKELNRAQGSLGAIGQKLSQAQEKVLASQKNLDAIGAEQASQSQALADLLAPSRESWRAQAEATENSLRGLSEAKKLHSDLQATAQKTLTLRQRRAELSPRRVQADANLLALTQRQADLSQLIESLEKNVTLAKQVASQEKLRAQLQAGEPCPLCGSREHPYAQGQVPQADQAEKDLAAAKLTVKKLTAEHNICLQAQTALLEEEKHLVSQLAESEASLAQTRSELAALGSTGSASLVETASPLATIITDLLATPTESFDPTQTALLTERLERSLEANQTLKNQIRDRLNQADALGESLAKLAVRAQKAQKELSVAQSQALEASLGQEKIQEDLARLERELVSAQSRAQEVGASLDEKLAPYGHQGVVNLDLAAVIKDLRTRKNQRQKLVADRLELEKSLIATNSSLELETPNLARLATDLAVKEAQGQKLQEELAALTARRRELLGDLDPEAESSRLNNEVLAAEESRKNLETRFREIETAVKLSQGRIADLEKALAERQNPLARGEAVFQAALIDKGLNNEAAFLAARLDETERAALTKQHEALRSQLAQNLSLATDKQTELTQEEAKNLSERTEAELTEALERSQARLREIRQSYGSIKERLAQDAKTRALVAEKSELVEKKKAEWRRLDKLSALIGQSDGGKFRNFAQSLTFERLVRNANLQLKKMSNRYLLRQDDRLSLEFNVIDNFQGGLTRPVKNLSGGETFLVSLALALGLSLMSSENVEVNSLFLDEGFGTLDEETLDLALSALAELPQAEGKTIGLISHVPGLGERISTQIKVVPQFGGHSQLVGPGCQRLG